MVNTVLPHPHHPKLDGVDTKHLTHCLAAAVHYTLHKRLFDKFKESQSGVAKLFLVECKKFFTSIMGCTYDAGKRLTKVEKKEKEAKEMELKKQKLEKAGQMTKVEKQEKEKEEQLKKDDGAPMDINDMPTLISDDESNDGVKGTKRKGSSTKSPPSPPPPQEKVTLCCVFF